MLGRCVQSFDAKKYIQGTLDVMTRGGTKNYMEMTISTKEDADKIYQDNINSFITSLTNSRINLNSEQSDRYRELFIKILGNTKYTVMEEKNIQLEII